MLYDALASLASRALGFPYERASVGSYLIYLAVGFAVARASTRSRVRSAALGTGLVGLVDATIGWGVSWAIGPGRIVDGTLSPARWSATAVGVVVFATIVGTVGGVLGARGQPAASRTA